MCVCVLRVFLVARVLLFLAACMRVRCGALRGTSKVPYYCIRTAQRAAVFTIVPSGSMLTREPLQAVPWALEGQCGRAPNIQRSPRRFTTHETTLHVHTTAYGEVW